MTDLSNTVGSSCFKGCICLFKEIRLPGDRTHLHWISTLFTKTGMFNIYGWLISMSIAALTVGFFQLILHMGTLHHAEKIFSEWNVIGREIMHLFQMIQLFHPYDKCYLTDIHKHCGSRIHIFDNFDRSICHVTVLLWQAQFASVLPRFRSWFYTSLVCTGHFLKTFCVYTQFRNEAPGILKIETESTKHPIRV